MRSTLVLLHVLAAVVWLGGMFFAHFCLRPAAIEALEPPKRLPLLEATFRRFFRYVSAAVFVLFATGLPLLLQVGFRQAPAGWHLMFTLGIVMAAVFTYIYASLYRQLRAHCAASAWPSAAQVVARIRVLVALNLALGVCAAVAAYSAR